MSGSRTESPVIVVCELVREHVACALEADGIARRLRRPFVPLLAGSAEDRHVRLALPRAEPLDAVPFREVGEPASGTPDDLLERLLHASAERAAAGPLWAVSGVDEWGLVGAAHAVLRGRRCIAVDVAAPPETRGVSSLALILSPVQCRDAGCDGLKELATAMLRARGTWGLLTASTPARLSNLLARITIRPRAANVTGRLFEQEDLPSTSPAVTGIEREVMPWHPYDGVRQLASNGIAFGAFIGHGRPYCAMTGNLCSRTTPAEEGDSRCSGGYECMFAKHRRVPARELRIDTVFLDSCSTSAFRSPGPQEDEALNLGVHLVDGFASAVIGPYRTSTPVPAAPALIWERLHGGESAGELTRAANALVASHLGSIGPFILFGDPEMTFVDEPEPRPVVAVDRTEGQPRLLLTRLPGRVVSHRLRDPQLAAALRTEPVHAISEDPEAGDLFHVLPVDEETVEVLVSWDAAPAADVAVHLVRGHAIRPDVVEIATDILDGQRHCEAWLRRPLDGDAPDAPRPMTELAAAVHGVQWELAQNGSIASSADFLRRYQLDGELLALCERAQADLLLRLKSAASKRSLWLFNELAETGAIRAVRDVVEDEPCPYCGGLVVAHVHDVGIWPRQRRRLLECERCLFLCDVEEGMAPLRMDCAETAGKGAILDVDVVARNAADGPALVHAAVTVDTMGAALAQTAIEPPMESTVLAPSAAARLGFRFHLAPDLPTHLYYLKALVFLNGRSAWAMRKVVVRDQGHMPV